MWNHLIETTVFQSGCFKFPSMPSGWSHVMLPSGWLEPERLKANLQMATVF